MRISTEVRGFTLIELLVVVAILSAAAMFALGTVESDRAQLRHDDTRHRLDLMERAILGRLGPADSSSVGGYVADNGRMPENVVSLLEAGTYQTQAALAPIFDPVPDTADCANNGGSSTTLTDSRAILIKGHREHYLGGAANAVFRDGWGNENSDAAADADNFGWVANYSVSSADLTLASLGADNAGGGSDYAADMVRALLQGDWLVPITGWTVRVFNYTGADIAARSLSASLLVFVNDGAGGAWRRYSTAADTMCLDGDGDGLVGGSPCATSSSLVFTAGCFPGDAAGISHARIPQGRHLLVLVDDADTNPWSSDDAVVFATSAPTRPISAQVTAIAGMGLPESRLELR